MAVSDQALLARILRSKKRADGSYPLDAMERSTREFSVWVARRDTGATLATIGQRFGYCAERTRAIIVKIDRFKAALERISC
jgi:DNA-directed RNA polymerase sigma subunit (sigma70/sigma32)